MVHNCASVLQFLQEKSDIDQTLFQGSELESVLWKNTSIFGQSLQPLLVWCRRQSADRPIANLIKRGNGSRQAYKNQTLVGYTRLFFSGHHHFWSRNEKWNVSLTVLFLVICSHFNKNQLSGPIPDALFSPEMTLIHLWVPEALCVCRFIFLLLRNMCWHHKIFGAGFLMEINSPVTSRTLLGLLVHSKLCKCPCQTKLCPIHLILLDELPDMNLLYVCLDSRLDRNSLSGPVPANLNNLTKVNEL